MAKKPITTITMSVHALLQPLVPAERIRAIKAALMLLGDDPNAIAGGEGDEVGEEKRSKLSTKRAGKVGAWMKANSLTEEQLSEVFHGSDIIAATIPGKDSKRQTIAVYVLTGIAAMLEAGEPTFDDKLARAACQSHGCYNSANHSAYLGAKGNSFTGSKTKGWSLTAPGLKTGADLIKQIAQG